MTEDGADTPESPWASDGVPMSADPPPIVWDVTPSDPLQSTTPVRSTAAPDATERGSATSATSTALRWWWPAAIVVGLVFVVVGALWRSAEDASDDGADSPASTQVRESIPTADTSPGATLPSTTGAGEPDGRDTTDGTVVSGTVELPTPVAAIERPTEIIAQTSDNLIHTLSLPSGRVRTVGVPRAAATNEALPGSVAIVASPSAALLSGYDTEVVIAPRVGIPRVVDSSAFGLDTPELGPQITPVGWIDDDGKDQFLVSRFDPENGVERLFSVTAEGVVSPVDSGRSVGFSSDIAAQGRHVVNDAGGVYVIGADRLSRRVSTGTALAASTTQVLLRECDERRQCEFVLQSIDSGDRTPVGMLPAAVAAGTYGLSLSPDGTAVSYTTFGLTNDRTIVDLADGPVASTTSTDFRTAGGWAPDGSGEFLAAEGGNGPDGLVFLDRATGDAMSFASELGRVVAIGVRYPDAESTASSFVEETAIPISTANDARTELRFVTLGEVGLTLLDLDARSAASWTSQPLAGRDDPQLFADGARVGAYTDSNGGAGFVASFGRAGDTLDANRLPSGPRFAGPDGRIWAADAGGADGFDLDYEQVNLAGSVPAGGGPPSRDVRQLRIESGTVLAGDGRGGLAFESGGDVYTSAGGGAERLTSGELLAIGATTAVVRECDDRLRCDAYTIDRATGTKSRSGIEGLASATAIGPRGSGPRSGSVSPDGGIALVELVSTGTASSVDEKAEKWVFFDLDTGNPIMTGRPEDGQPVVWNAAGTYAAYVSNGQVMVYEHSTGTALEVPGTQGTRALTTVDALFGTDPHGG